MVQHSHDRVHVGDLAKVLAVEHVQYYDLLDVASSLPLQTYHIPQYHRVEGVGSIE